MDKNIPCKRIVIKGIIGKEEFAVGLKYKTFFVSHITVNFDSKIAMIRDKDNRIEIISFDSIKAELDPAYKKGDGINVRNLFF
jgi:hypothetical protein